VAHYFGDRKLNLKEVILLFAIGKNRCYTSCASPERGPVTARSKNFGAFRKFSIISASSEQDEDNQEVVLLAMTLGSSWKLPPISGITSFTLLNVTLFIFSALSRAYLVVVSHLGYIMAEDDLFGIVWECRRADGI
jgi:hypothetical protein